MPLIASLLAIITAITLANWRILFFGLQGKNTGTVTDIVDGDTIKVDIGGKTETVRYIGVNTPERGQPGYRRAVEENRKLVGWKSVRLETDKQKRDKYGRLLCYVWTGRRFVNRELVKRRVAEVMEVEPNVKRIKEIER